MELGKYLEKRGTRLIDFAEELGVSASIAKFWAVRGTSPRLVHALKIVKYTKGKVKLEDLLTDKDRELLCQ